MNQCFFLIKRKITYRVNQYLNSYKGEVQVGTIRKRHNQKEIPTTKTEVGKTKLTLEYLHIVKHIVSRVSSYFPIGSNSVTRTYIKI